MNSRELILFTAGDSNNLTRQLQDTEEKLKLGNRNNLWSIYGKNTADPLYTQFDNSLLASVTTADSIPSFLKGIENPRVLDLMSPIDSLLVKLVRKVNLAQGDCITLIPSPGSGYKNIPNNLREHNGDISKSSTWSNLRDDYNLITLRPVGGIVEEFGSMYLFSKLLVRALNRLTIGGIMLIDLRYARYLIENADWFTRNLYSHLFITSGVYKQTQKIDGRTGLMIAIRRINEGKVTIPQEYLDYLVGYSAKNLHFLNSYLKHIYRLQNTDLKHQLRYQITELGKEFASLEPADCDGDLFFTHSTYIPNLGPQSLLSFNSYTGATEHVLFNPLEI